MMQEPAAVVLSDSQEGCSVTSQLSRHGGRMACYTDLAQLLDEHPPGSVPVLVFHLHERPKGSLLAVIGRLTVEHPGVQKVAVTDAPMSLEVAGYLTACDVDLVPEGQDASQLASVVTRMNQRRQRCLAAS